MFKPIFPHISLMLMPFPRFERLSVVKNTNATFFRVGGSNSDWVTMEFLIFLNVLKMLLKVWKVLEPMGG